jgi:hypothetical protein
LESRASNTVMIFACRVWVIFRLHEPLRFWSRSNYLFLESLHLAELTMA